VNDPFVLLPANLGPVVNVAAGGRLPTSALNGVHVTLIGGSYDVVATDGRRLIRVTGAADVSPLDFPAVPELAASPSSAERAVIPPEEWKQAFHSVPRGREAELTPVLKHVAVHLGAAESILATSDGGQSQVTRATNGQGRYPDYQAVIPNQPPQMTVHLDARLLVELLRVVLAFTPDETNRVALEIHAPDRPLVLRTAHAGQECLALLMPQVP
jgi:DNA polymerase III sliding clamp (beta) subunit (PCNA family)